MAPAPNVKVHHETISLITAVVVSCNGDKSFRCMLGQQCCWAREKSRENITCSRLQHANWFHKLWFARSSRRGGLHNQMLVSAFYVLRRSKAEEKTGRESAKSKLAPNGNFKCGAAWPIIPLHPLYFIWIFHLKLISKIAQVDYRTAAPHNISIPTSSAFWGREENWFQFSVWHRCD